MSKDEIKDLSKDEKLTLVNAGNIFCIRKFATGLVKKVINFIFEIILSAEFLVWMIFTIAFFHETTKEMWMWIAYGLIAIVFILAKPLKHLIKEKTNLNIDHKTTLGATAALNVVGDLNKAAQQVVENIGGKK